MHTLCIWLFWPEMSLSELSTHECSVSQTVTGRQCTVVKIEKSIRKGADSCSSQILYITPHQCHFVLYLMEQCVILTVELHEITEIIKDFTQSIWNSDKSASHTDKQTRKRYASGTMASGETKSMKGNVKSSLNGFNHNTDNSFWRSNRQQQAATFRFCSSGLDKKKRHIIYPLLM